MNENSSVDPVSPPQPVDRTPRSNPLPPSTVDEHVSVLASRVRLSTWLRVVLVGSFGLLLIAMALSAMERLATTGLDGVVVAELVGAALSAVMCISSAFASCTVRVTPEDVTVSFWVLFRVTIPASEITELRADAWNSWDFGGYGLKGGPKQGWLLNASADGTGAGDSGVLVRTMKGRAYRVEVPEPERFAEQATAVLALR